VKRFILSIILALSLLTQTCISQPNLKETQHAAMHWLLFQTEKDSWYCTGYAISAHAVLTAGHCDAQGMSVSFDKELELNPVPVEIISKYFDGNDHMIFVVPSVTFVDTINYNPKKYKLPKQGEHVYYWGNPEHLRDLYREGYTSGVDPNPNTDLKHKDAGIYFIINAEPGDSGSAVFAEGGRLVTLVSASGGSILMLGFPLAFTPQQVSEAEQ
jgi:hypothetical protein